MTFSIARIFTRTALASLVWFAACQTSLSEEPKPTETTTAIESAMDIQYLEIVTPDVDATCATLSELHSVAFGAPEPGFGNARIAMLSNGGRLGVRAPLSGDEGAPLVRPYLRVENIEAAIASAEASGAEFAMLATEIPGHGTFAIYFQGGIQYGLWEL